MTTQELLAHLLMNGWEWKKSDRPGYVALGRDDFSWLFEAEYFDVRVLLECIAQEAFHRGKKFVAKA